MIKKILCTFIFSLACLLVVLGFRKSHIGPSETVYDLRTNPVEMPLVLDDPFAAMAHGGIPQEQRDEKFRKWLSVSLKISVTNASGSGTIIYYDENDGWAYVQSCGHLWTGTMTAEQGKKKNLRCRVVTWYHNDSKLDTTKSYEAEVLYYSNVTGKDVSLLKFKPDWRPNYFPIAPEDFPIAEGTRLHSLGCDGGGEVAHYDVRVIGRRGNDLVTTENSPRPGRSGGGLMTDEYYVGICWGTSDRSGNGNGYFTPLGTLRHYNQINGFGWLNNVQGNLARRIPIIDHNNPPKKLPNDFIPLPQN